MQIPTSATQKGLTLALRPEPPPNDTAARADIAAKKNASKAPATVQPQAVTAASLVRARPAPVTVLEAVKTRPPEITPEVIRQPVTAKEATEDRRVSLAARPAPQPPEIEPIVIREPVTARRATSDLRVALAPEPAPVPVDPAVAGPDGSTRIVPDPAPLAVERPAVTARAASRPEIVPTPAPAPPDLPDVAARGETPTIAPAPEIEPRDKIDLRELSRSLVTELFAAGFEQQPPSNLHDLLDALDLDKTERKSVLHQLTRQYPDGLGVNLTG